MRILRAVDTDTAPPETRKASPRALRRPRLRLAVAALAVLGLGGAAAATAAAARYASDTSQILKVRVGENGDETRLVVEMDQPASARLMADAGAASQHIVIALPNARTGAALSVYIGELDSRIAAFASFATVPTGLMFLVSVFYINSSFDKWFSVRMASVLKASLEVNQEYIFSSKKKNYHFANQIAKEIAATGATAANLSAARQARA